MLNATSLAPKGKPVADMIFDKDVAVPVRDGLVLRANVFRPRAPGRYPVIMTFGPYGKDVHFADGYERQWRELVSLYPDICQNGTSGRYLRWEVPDAERWVPHGYVIVVVDSRGTGKSPGKLQVWSPQETQDYHDAIEWAGVQPWSNGKVGLLGISYMAINQWQVAALNPPHLAAIAPWEGFSDFYRDMTHHGGILSHAFVDGWWPRQVLVNQHGNGESRYRDPDTSEPTTGPARSAADLKADRVDYPDEVAAHAFDDAWHAERTPDFNKIKVPILSGGNWGGLALHLRGNVEGYLRSASPQKWLELHGGTHFETFYMPHWADMQRRFFDRYLKGADNGWDKTPPVILQVRWPDKFIERHENEWPLARTQWTEYFLDAAASTVGPEKPSATAKASYRGLEPGLRFMSAPFAADTEFTGPIGARLWMSSSTADMDIFVTVQIFDPAGNEVTFSGASEAAVPVTQGWLRASHRATDPAQSKPWRPYRLHKKTEPVTPGEVYPLDIEIWPTSMVFPKGYRMSVLIEGRDFSRAKDGGPRTGSGPFVHTHPANRDPAVFGGTNTLFTGGDRASYLLMPVIR